MIFSEQEVHCNACGKKFKTNFQRFGGKCCSLKCHKEIEWKHALSILGQEYEPQKDSVTQD